MRNSATPEGIGFNQDHVVVELCHGRGLPDTQPIFKAVDERYTAFSSGKPHKFRWCRDSSHAMKGVIFTLVAASICGNGGGIAPQPCIEARTIFGVGCIIIPRWDRKVLAACWINSEVVAAGLLLGAVHGDSRAVDSVEGFVCWRGQWLGTEL